MTRARTAVVSTTPDGRTDGDDVCRNSSVFATLCILAELRCSSPAFRASPSVRTSPCHSERLLHRIPSMSMPLDARVGWWTILKRTFKEVIDDNCLGLAAQLAYYFFLSLFPALLVVVTLTSFFPYHVLDDILALVCEVHSARCARHHPSSDTADHQRRKCRPADLRHPRCAVEQLVRDERDHRHAESCIRREGSTRLVEDASSCSNSDHRPERVHARVAHACPGWT